MTRAGVKVGATALWLLAFASPAEAGLPRFPETPKAAPVVAGPTPSGARLVVFDREGALCGDVRTRGEDFSGPADCGRPSGRLRDPSMQAEFDGRRTYHWGFVAAEVASVELVFEDGPRTLTPAETGSRYTGRYAGRVRFFLAEASGPRERDPLYVRLLDGAGRLLAVQPGIAGLAPRRTGPRTRLIGGRVGRAHWRLEAFDRRQFAPLPGDEERFQKLTCVSLSARGSGTRAETCTGSDFPDEDLSVGIAQECNPVGGAVAGIASGRATRVVAVLGDGRQRRLSLRPFPGSFGGARAFALAVGPGVAIRRLVAFGSNSRIRTVRLEQAPGSVRCGVDVSTVVLRFFGEEHLPPPPLDADGLTFLVRDRGVLICAGIDALASRGRDCFRPPLRAWESRLLSRVGQRETLFAGVLPQEVAAVELQLDGGEKRRVATAPGGPYSGRYSEYLRFFSLTLPGRRQAYSARLLDERGKSIESVGGPDQRPLLAGFRTVLRAGKLRLGVALSHPFGAGAPQPCLELTEGRYSQGADCGGFSGAADLRAFCGSRGLVLSGLLRRGARSIAVRTDRGLVRGRLKAFFPAANSKRFAFLIVVPPGHTPRALIRVGRNRVQQKLQLPSASKQCGYSDVVFLESAPRRRP